MRKISFLLLRALIIAAGIAGITAAVYALNGGQTTRGLSDWLVYASFLTLAVGTLLGIANVGYKRAPAAAGEPEEGRFEHLVKDFFLAGSLGIAFALAGPLCFAAAVLVDIFLR